VAWAQDVPDDAPPTLLNHDPGARVFAGGQANFIFQMNPSLPARYNGPNSFGPEAGHALSRVLTFYATARVSDTTDVVVHFESAGGTGLNDGAGLGGATNLDVVRNPTLSHGVYVARASLRHVFRLSADEHQGEPGPLSALQSLPDRRIEIRVGKFGMVDYFDLNAVGSDSHRQFMNWTVDNNGAYDYAADTRGYTVGAVIEYYAPRWELRFGEGLMPTTANGIVLDWDVARARGENVEVVLHRRLFPAGDGRIRLLGYLNHAQMGTYAAAISAIRAGSGQPPDIVQTRRPGTLKYGAGLNVEQAFGEGVRAFMRAGWNDGSTETFTYTEVDRTVTAGADITGWWWHRPHDQLGVTAVINGLSALHREYLALGGQGFQLGDGGLSYGHERIIEMYYTVPLVRGVFASVDLQRIVSPGFNADRGPVIVPGVRLHVEF
jgi:hypothetical protein